MNLLVPNLGSTSLKYQVLEMPSERVLSRGRLERVQDYREAVAQQVRTAPRFWGVETLIFVLMVLIFVVAVLRVRRRSREIRSRMEQDELLERLFQQSYRRNASWPPADLRWHDDRPEDDRSSEP